MRSGWYLQYWCPLILLILNTVKTGASSLSEECKTEYEIPQDPSPHACVCNESEPDSLKKELCSSSSEAALESFDLYVKKESDNTCLARGSISKLTAEMLDSSCYLKRYEEMKDLVPLLRNLVSGTGKLSSNESSSFADLLPDGSCIHPKFKCIEDTNNKIVSVCGGSSYGGASTHIKFDMDAYSNTATCTCKIKSDVSFIKIRAVDVRLENDGSLQMKGDRGNSYNFDPNKIYWWQDGDLLQHNKEVIIELSKLDSSNPPVSMWLQIDGSKLNVTCAGRNTSIIDVPDVSSSSELTDIQIIGIVVGIVALLFVILIFLKCMRKNINICKRTKDDYPLDDRSSVNDRNVQIMSSSYAHSQQPQRQDSASQQLLENNYMILEHDYEDPEPSNNNFKEEVHYAEAHQPPKKPPRLQQENVYNHLREQPDAVPNGNIYDTTAVNDYAHLGRKEQPAITDNTYSSL